MPDNHQVDIGTAHATFQDVVLPMGLRVDSVKMAISTLHIDSHPFSTSAPEPGELEVFVSDKSLTEFLNLKSPGGLRNFAVESKAGKLIVQASMVIIIEIRATAVCTLRIAGGKQLFVDLEHVSVMGAGATNLVQSQLERINPVMDVAEFPIAATLDQVRIADGGIKILGRVTPP